MLISLLFFAVVSLAPLIAATFVSGRLGRRGLWQILPWVGFVVLSLAVGGLMYLLGDPVADPEASEAGFPPMFGAWVAGLLVGGYLSTLVYLIVLAAVGPARSRTAAADVF